MVINIACFLLKGKPLHLQALLEQLILRWPREYLTNGRLSLQLKKRGSQRRPEPKQVHVGFGKSPPQFSTKWLSIKWPPRVVSDLFSFCCNLTGIILQEYGQSWETEGTAKHREAGGNKIRNISCHNCSYSWGHFYSASYVNSFY